MEDLICIGTYNTRTEAEIARGFLESNGIKAVVSADDAGGAYPFPFQSSSSGVKLLVNEKDAQKAKEILDRYTNEILKTPENL